MDLEGIAKNLGKLLQEKKLALTTAESCTGGWVAKVMTSRADSSTCFERGFVTYSDESKQEMLGVDPQLIKTYGAVSKPVASQMAENALNRSHAHVSLAITGVAGPDRDDSDNPVGTVWFAWSRLNYPTLTECLHLEGDRTTICEKSVEHALKKLLELLKNESCWSSG